MGYKKFSGLLAFLSNFHSCKVIVDGLTFKSAEAAYQSYKNLEHQKEFLTLGAYDSKKYARTLPLRADWDKVKLEVMRKVVAAKFNQNVDLAKLLMKTPDEDLVEENTWGDTFWGVCEGKGQNNLGKILKEIKYQLITGGLRGHNDNIKN